MCLKLFISQQPAIPQTSPQYVRRTLWPVSDAATALLIARFYELHKRIVFDAETWRALHQLSLETMRSTQELADEAFHDLLKKHHRPTSLKEMLRQSARLHPANDERTGGQAPVRKK
jgi:hypothetical protein